MTPLNRAIASKFMIGAVARVMKPGCKLDTMPILEGPQGIGKSQAIGILGGEWFTDDVPADITSKDAAMALQASWVIEQGELHAIRKADVNQLKNFLSRRVDKFRPPYGRTVQSFPRKCVLIGSMNPTDNGYLNDETGARRFWPVLCAVGWADGRKIDLAALWAVRDQLWAEARVRFEQGEPWWLHRDHLEKDQEAEADMRFDADAWTEKVLEFLSGKPSITMDEVLNALGIDTKDWSRATVTRVGAILSKAKWKRRRVTEKNGSRVRRYFNPVVIEKDDNVVPIPPPAGSSAGGTRQKPLADLFNGD